jgi:hypothetical protein
MSKSAIYTVNNTTQAVAVGGTINLGTINRRFGQCIDLAGTGIQLNGPGYYNVEASFTVEPTAAGTVIITMYKDGVAVPGAVAYSTATAADDPVNLSISSIVRKFCPCADGIESLTFVLTGTAANIINSAVVVEKL